MLTGYKKAYLLLADGTVFEGRSFGAEGSVIGEIVFTTAMVGYQETLTDPSYCGQIVTQTFPLIGNYGVNDDDYESCGSVVSGYIVREYCEEPSNFRCEDNIDNFLKKYGIIGLYDIDTRRLTRIIRESGVMNGMITNDPDFDKDKCLENLRLQNEFNAQMDAFANEYETALQTNEFNNRKKLIIKELDELMIDSNSVFGSRSRALYIKERDTKLSELDSLFRMVLNDLQSKGIAKYRSFCSENKISDKTEIDMESAKYASLRTQLVNESKELYKKYSPVEEDFPDGYEIRKYNEKEESILSNMFNNLIFKP